ncbi:hypothetical protein [Pseudoalteromonas sp. D48-MNA-CIBAN-0056]|uniref:hypothetical protein n=1 Tax=Pseudoalteromonas sp. D48-MNA-CIBAN-0056 TaxID=3140417 RepID=UPI00332BE7C4
MRPALTNALTNAIRSAFNYTANEAAEAEQWVAQLDGAMQSWQLTSPINLIANDIVELSFTGGQVSNAFAMFLESDSRNFYISTTSDSLNFRVKAAFGSPMLNDQLIDNNVTPVPSNGDNTTSAATVGAEVMSYITSRAGSSLFLSLAVYNFRVIRNGVVIHEIPLTNKEQGATQLATVGNINAFMPNYTNAVWRKP